MKGLLLKGVAVVTGVMALLVVEAMLAQNAVQDAVTQQTSGQTAGQTEMGIDKQSEEPFAEQPFAEALADFRDAVDNSDLPTEVKSFYENALDIYDELV